MKYCVLFKRNDRKLTKKLLYKKFMDKKIGKNNYQIEDLYNNGRYVNSYNGRINIVDDNNLFRGGILVSFVDKKSFSKFLLAKEAVINPSIKLNDYVTNVLTYNIEDDVVKVGQQICENYKIETSKLTSLNNLLDSLFNLKTSIEQYKISYNKYFSYIDEKSERLLPPDNNDIYFNEQAKSIYNAGDNLINNNEYIFSEMKPYHYTKSFLNPKSVPYYVYTSKKVDNVKKSISKIFNNISKIFY